MPNIIDAGRFPAHALAEIEADPSQLPFWERWAAVGDAKGAAREAAARMVVASDEWRACRKRAGHDTPGPDCECGQCQDRYLRLRSERDAAVIAVSEAIDTFKEG